MSGLASRYRVVIVEPTRTSTVMRCMHARRKCLDKKRCHGGIQYAAYRASFSTSPENIFTNGCTNFTTLDY